MESNHSVSASYRLLSGDSISGSYDDETDNASAAASGVYYNTHTSAASVASESQRCDEQVSMFSMPSRPRLNHRNYANLVMYVTSLTAFLVMVFGHHGLTRGMENILRKHQTLITPAGWTQVIWAAIFFLEGIFAATQMFPAFRARPMVQEGVKFWFAYICLGQTAWSLFFFLGQFLLAFLSICFLLFSLICLMVSQHMLQQSRASRQDYFLIRFPFSIHIGWIFSMTALNLAMVLLEYGCSDASQLSIAIVALAVLLLVAVFFIAIISKPDFGVPAVVIWALFGIAAELKSPTDAMLARFGDLVTEGVCSAAFWCGGILLGLYIPRSLYVFCHHHFTIAVVQH